MSQDHRHDWDLYWRSAAGMPVFGQFSQGREPLRAFWSEFLEHALGDRGRTRVLDIACGSGAVTTVSHEICERIGRADVAHFCLDYSADAVSDLRKRMPGVHATASDAGAAPYVDGAFHLVASQFGLEYAGPSAFAEAARLVAPGGIYCAICHLESGAIYRECRDNLDVIESVLNCRFMPLARTAFNELFALDRGEGTTGAAEDAHRALEDAAAKMRSLIEEVGPEAAHGTPVRLYRDVGHMYGRWRNYEPQAVLDWLNGMTKEITGYAGRMKSMVDAALDATAVGDIRQSLISAGLTVEDPAELRMGPNAEPGAWILKAAR